MSEDERFNDLGIWTRYKHESFKLVTYLKRDEISKRIREILNLTDNDFKVVGITDLFILGGMHF